MGKGGSPKQQVTDYFMSIHFGICAEADSLLAIYVNEKLAYQGDLRTPSTVTIDRPDLFGGPKREGGVAGRLTYLPGSATQVMPENLAQKLGRTSATCPGFRGLASVFFHGSGAGVVSVGPFSLTAGADGFRWTSNNPIVAQTVWAKVQRAPKGLGTSNSMISGDANPAHIVFEALTNTDWGMGSPVELIDTASFTYAASVFASENFGLSMIWSRQTTIEAFVSEVLDHVDASLFVHPRTGLITLKVIRDDYVVEMLRTITIDNADLSNPQRKLWGETINEIVVTWTNPENEQDETVTYQNLSNIEAQGGQIVSDGRNYYGVRNRALAEALAVRDLRAAAAPLASLDAELLRTEWDIVPGDVVKVLWPEKQINGVFRVGSIDYGKVGEGHIKVSLVEDIFSLQKPLIAAAAPTQWIDASELPTSMDHVQILTLPYYFAAGTDVLSRPVDIEFPEVVAGVLAKENGFDTRSYELVGEVTSAAGQVEYQSLGTKTTVGRVSLVAALARESSSLFSANNVTDPLNQPITNGFLFIGSDEATQEIALVTGFDGSNYSLQRGVLDTVPRAWAAGTPVWFLNPGQRIADEQIIRSAGETVTYRLLTTTSLGTLGLNDAPDVEQTLTDRPYRPLRPANVQVNGQGFSDTAIGASQTITVSWATRNRLFEDAVVTPWTAASVSPEYRQRTIVQVLNDANSQVIVEYRHLWTESQIVLQKVWFDRFSAIRIRVFAEREGFTSLVQSERRVTGFANNPAAALPPAPPEPGEPPAPAAAPAAGAFTLQAVAISDGNSSLPALIVTGTANDRDAVGLVVRYRKTAVTDWAYMPEIALTGIAVRIEIATVAPQTEYEVQVLYRYANNLPSQWRSLGTATTAALISGNTLNVGGRTAAQINADIQALLEASPPDQTDLNEAIEAAESARDQAIASAIEAGGYAATAQTARDTATGAASSASGSATTANTRATDAAASASAAASSASAAGTSATGAAQSASSATTSANTATIQSGNAANSATAAASSAATASSSAAAAQTSASLAATVATGALNPNANFDRYTFSLGLPDDWQEWVSGGQGYRVSDGLGGFAYRLANTASEPDKGIARYADVPSSSGYWFVLEGDVLLNSGSLNSAGVLVFFYRDGVDFYGQSSIHFGADSDISGSQPGPGVVGRIYRFRKLIQAPTGLNPGGQPHNQIFIFAANNYNQFGPAVAKDLTWLRCAIRPASDAEIAARRADQNANQALASIDTLSQVVVTGPTALASRTVTLEAQIGNAAPSGLSSRVAGAESNIATVGSRAGTLEQQVANTAPSGLASRIEGTESNVATVSSRATSLEQQVGNTAPSGLGARIGVTESVVATHDGKLAAYIQQVAAAGPNEAFIRIMANNQASAIMLAASAIGLYNPSGGELIRVLEIIGGIARFAKPIEIQVGSAKLCLGPAFGANSDLVMWFGGNLAQSAMSKSNAIMWMDTSGNSFFAGNLRASIVSGDNIEENAYSQISRFYQNNGNNPTAFRAPIGFATIMSDYDPVVINSNPVAFTLVNDTASTSQALFNFAVVAAQNGQSVDAISFTIRRTIGSSVAFFNNRYPNINVTQNTLINLVFWDDLGGLPPGQTATYELMTVSNDSTYIYTVNAIAQLFKRIA